MAGIEQTVMRVPDVWSAAWFRDWVVNHLSKADVRNAKGVGIEITSEGNSVATLSTSADTDAALQAHNADPFANEAAFNAHRAEMNPHPPLQLPLHSVYITTTTDNPATLLGYGSWVELSGGPGWVGSHAWERVG